MAKTGAVLIDLGFDRIPDSRFDRDEIFTLIYVANSARGVEIRPRTEVVCSNCGAQPTSPTLLLRRSTVLVGAERSRGRHRLLIAPSDRMLNSVVNQNIDSPSRLRVSHTEIGQSALPLTAASVDKSNCAPC